ncbi:hypothetical protein BJY01DRAFT_259280 [Aspergillus pseudoustus]|uniref:DUF7580 domain-containing protein n=1 Tax=Aspergillus pseudoustus TaxID=1810923 RepID=A0ABR4J5L5_9EURO
MPGLEIVGVVIGVIPFVIKAVEKYRQGKGRIRLRGKDPMLRRLLQSLDAQHWLLQADIRLTLEKAGVPYDRDCDELSPTIFQDARVSDAVDEYLGNDGTIYYKTVNRCHMALAELIQGIGGLKPMPKNMTELVSTYPTNGGEYELPKKIHFPIKHEELARYTDELNNAISTLQSISSRISSLREHAIERPSSKQVATFASAMNTVRSHAARLYSAISMAYATNCHTQHEARLFLQSRCDYKGRQAAGGTKKDLTFTVSFSPTVSSLDAIAAYKGNITVVEPDDSGQPIRRNNTGRHVTIRVPARTTAQSTSTSAMADICGSIRQAREGGLVLDLYLSESRSLTYCALHDTGVGISMHLSQPSDDFVPLEDLLQGKVGEPWVAIPKIALSLVGASSLLQLVTTPWLRFPLTCRSVRFSRAAIEAAALNPTGIPEPFVAERFSTPANMSQACRTCSVKEYMLELGILLLEIQHWMTIAQYRADRLSSGQPDLVTRYDLARAWIDATQLELLGFHSKVIERCIEFTFASNNPTPSWDDAVLRKSIAEYVIRPLQEHCPPGFQ